MEKETIRVEIADRSDLKENPDHDQGDHHGVCAQRFGGDTQTAEALLAEIGTDQTGVLFGIHGGHDEILSAACPVAAAITLSAVASSRRNSPLM